MTRSHNDPLFAQILEKLATREPDAALAAIHDAAGDLPSPASGLARLIALGLGGHFSELASFSHTWSEAPLRMVQALGAVALARQEPSEEALRLGLEAAWLPARPLPAQGDEALSSLWRLWEEDLATQLLSRLEPEPLGNGPTTDPFLSALLSLADPLPPRAAHRLRVAVESGLDLAPVRLTLARLLRLAGDRDGARGILTELATANLEAPWAMRVTAELEACARDEELEGASQVQLELTDRVRTLRHERGLFLTVEERPHTWMRQVEPETRATSLRELVEDHLDAGWMVSAWIPKAPEDDLDRSFARALESGSLGEALSVGRSLMSRRPEDAALASSVLGASVGLRGPLASIELSQRLLVLAAEPPWALRQHAALLWGMGAVEECLGTLFYLEELHGQEAFSPASFAIAAACHLVPRYRPGVARMLLGHGLSRFPGHPALVEMQARLELFQGEHEAALSTLEPILAGPRPSAAALGLGLQCLLEGELEGTEALAQRAQSLYPEDPLLLGLFEEIAGAAKKAMGSVRTAVEEAPTPMVALENQLYFLRAAYRMSAFEEGLRLARQTQALLGEPDPRCLEVIYQCLTALEPGEDREDLAEVAEEARRRAWARTLSKEDRLRAMLSVGFHLDPSLLEDTWAAWAPGKTQDPLPAATPEPSCALLPLATDTGFVTLFDSGFVTLFDSGGQIETRSSKPTSWLEDPEAVSAQQAAGRLVLAPVTGGAGPHWLRVTTHEPVPRDRYRLAQKVTLKVPSGRVFAGPGEALLGGPPLGDPDSAPDAPPQGSGGETHGGGGGGVALALELGGRFRLMPQGLYQVKVWHRLDKPWPQNEISGDPVDVVFQICAP